MNVVVFFHTKITLTLKLFGAEFACRERAFKTDMCLNVAYVYFFINKYYNSVLIRWVVSLRVACVMQYLARPETEGDTALHKQ